MVIVLADGGAQHRLGPLVFEGGQFGLEGAQPAVELNAVHGERTDMLAELRHDGIATRDIITVHAIEHATRRLGTTRVERG